MPAIDKKESLRKLADIAEGMGFRVWFDFKQCHIHEMYGKEIARFDLDDQSRFWIDSTFLVASKGRYFREICDILETFVQQPGRQTRAYADDLTKVSDENASRTPSDNDNSPGQNNQNNPGGNNNNFFRANF